MSLNEVKTKSQFWEFSENWYQRVHKLRRVWQNETETQKRKEKAFKLWQIMTQRILYLASIARNFTKTTKSDNFAKGSAILSE